MKHKEAIRIGSRRSPLARWQAEWVGRRLEATGYKISYHYTLSEGDRNLNVPVSELGTQAVFTKALEDELQRDQIDIAVHSAKDLPARLPEGFEIIAFTSRDAVHDVLLSASGRWMPLGEGLRIGTSAPRRVAQLAHYFPQSRVVSLRGNVERRIRLLSEGACDLLLLAAAAVVRSGYASWIIQSLHPRFFVPAVGQGSLAVEVRSEMSSTMKQRLSDLLNDPLASEAITSERSFLEAMGAGCHTPVFGLATIEQQAIQLHAGRYYEGHYFAHQQSAPLGHARALGQKIADYVQEKINNFTSS